MNEIHPETKIDSGEKVYVPEWFVKYANKLREDETDLLKEVDDLSKMTQDQVNKHIGGNFQELPYEFLDTMFIGGTDDERVAAELRKKREIYLKTHPEKSRGVSGIDKGIVTFDGRFIPQKTWVTATDSEKRGALVGSTCFHYNSDTPGMDSSPEDRF